MTRVAVAALVALAVVTAPVVWSMLQDGAPAGPAGAGNGSAAEAPPATPASAPLQLGRYALACGMEDLLARCNVQLTVDTGPANEVMLAANPRDPLEFLAVAKDYHLAAPGAASCVGTAFYHTVDGGLTWVEGLVAEPTEPCETDPVAAFDGNGEPFITTWRLQPRELVTYRLGEADGAWFEAGRTTGAGKQWVGASGSTGTLFLVDASDTVRRSVDGGLTWTAAASGLRGFAKQLAVAPDGRVVVAGVGDRGLLSYVSADDGLTFAGPFELAAVRFPVHGVPTTLDILTGSTIQTAPTFGLAADPASGRMWAAFPGVVGNAGPLPATVGARLGNLQWDVWVSHSDDGATWSAPVKVNDDPGVAAQFFPTVAVTPDGVAHVAWMDQRLDPSGLMLDVYYANTAPGSGLANVRITDQPFLSPMSYQQDGAVSVGEYIGIAAGEDRVVVAWPDTRHGRAEIFAALLEAQA